MMSRIALLVATVLLFAACPTVNPAFQKLRMIDHSRTHTVEQESVNLDFTVKVFNPNESEIAVRALDWSIESIDQVPLKRGRLDLQKTVGARSTATIGFSLSYPKNAFLEEKTPLYLDGIFHIKGKKDSGILRISIPIRESKQGT